MKKLHTLSLLTTTAILAIAAYDNQAGWKLDADGKIEMKDGNPIYLDSTGKEMTVQGDTISKLNGEAKGHRERAEAAETKLKAYGDLDPEKAKKAIETVSKIDAKTLIDAGEVDRVKETIKAEFTGQLTELQTALTERSAAYDNLLVSNIFNGSEFVRDNVAVPLDMFEASFKSNFKVEDGKIVAYGKDGNKLLSKSRQGEYATPDEALQLLVDMHPQKDTILKANVGNGSGNNGGGGNRGGGRNIKRSDFEKLSPVQQSETSKKINAGEMTMSD